MYVYWNNFCPVTDLHQDIGAFKRKRDKIEDVQPKGSFTYRDCDCESDFAKNGSIVFQYYHSHLAKVNIKGKV